METRKVFPKKAIDGNMMFMLIITKITLIIWVGRMNMNGVLIVWHQILFGLRW